MIMFNVCLMAESQPRDAVFTAKPLPHTAQGCRSEAQATLGNWKKTHNLEEVASVWTTLD